MAYETIVGRLKEDLEKFGSKACGYIGKHIVGTGEDTHLTTKVFLDLLRPHIILVCGKRGSGKCVTGDTLVYLSNGELKPIEKIVREGKEVKILSLNPKNFLMEESHVVKFFEREVDEIVKIKLWNGLEIKVTKNHPLLTPFGWKEAKEIKIGDYIALPSKVKIKSNLKMDVSKLKILACLLSEGTIRGTFVWFTNAKNEIVKEFMDAVKKFDDSLEIKKYEKMTYRVGKKPLEVKNLKFSSKGFAPGTKTIVRRNSLLKWLDSLGLKNKRSEEKFIPPIIFSLSDENVALFLRYLFAGDGSLYEKKAKRKNSTYTIEYVSKSKVLVEQIYYLLLRFGIFSYIREKKVEGKLYYRLFITNKKDVEKFITKVGILGSKRLVKKILNDKRNFHSNFDVLPKEIWNYIRQYNKKDIGKSLNYKNYKGVSTKYKYNPLKSTIRKIGEFFNDKFLIKISSPEICWIKIIRIDKIQKPTKVFDITVNDHHNFIGNGIFLHNSYSAAVIAEEIALLPEEFRKRLAVIMIDSMGIFWSFKIPNNQQERLLKEWNLQPKAFEDVKVFVPFKQVEEFKKAGIPVDAGISIAPFEFSSEEWRLAFNLSATEPAGIALEKNVNELLETEERFTIEDLITKIRDDKETSKEIKDALENMLRVANQWGLFGIEGIDIAQIVKSGQISIIDVSRLRATEAWSVRNLLIAIIAKRIYQERLIARKEEEVARIEGREPERKFPMVWLIIDEAHLAAPADLKTVSSEPLLTIAKQGREPGISLVVITQMPNKIHQDILSQCDLVISHRLTSKADLDALHTIMQTYMKEEIWRYINILPRWPGAAIILDDNLEKIFSVNIRPRLSWHGGGTAALI